MDIKPEILPWNEIKERIAAGDIAPGKDSAEDAAIRKASPSISAEWAGY